MTMAYSYLRLSTKIQLKGDGQRRQMEDTIESATKNGWTLSDQTFHDLGVSAFKGDNLLTGALNTFLRLVEGGKIPKGSVLMVENPDRISREGVTKSVTILMTLLSADINVYTTADGRMYSGQKETAFLDLITWGIAAERGHDESARKSERILKAKEAQRVRARETGHIYSKACPHWMEVVGEGDKRSHLLLKEPTEVIKIIFKLRLEGWGIYDITRYLDKSKYAPHKSKNRREAGVAWHTSTIKRWLVSRTVIGEFQPTTTLAGKRVNAGEPIRNYFPAIISEEDFRRVRGTFKETKQGRVPNQVGANVFRGLLKCSCGSGLHVSIKRSKTMKKGVEKKLTYRKIECPRSRSQLCSFKNIHYHLIEGLVMGSLRHIEWEGMLKSKEKDDDTLLESLRKTLTERRDYLFDVDKKMGNLISSIASGGINVHLQKMLDELTVVHADVSLEATETERKYEDLKTSKSIQKEDALRISETINLILEQAAHGDERLRLCTILNQHLSKVEIVPETYVVTVYDNKGVLIATITPLDDKLHFANVVTPKLEWGIEQHFKTNRVTPP